MLMNGAIQGSSDIITYLPYIVTVVCALISGFASYYAARKQAKSEIQKLIKQHELDIEKEHEKFAIEKERMEIEHKHKLEATQKELESKLGNELFSTITKEYIRSPAGQAQLKCVNKRTKK